MTMTFYQYLISFVLVVCISSCSGFFQEVTQSGKRNWRGVATSSDGTKQAAVVLGGSIWLSTDSGNTWNEHDNENITTNPWMAVTSSNTGEILMAANFDEGLYVSSNSGLDWDMMTDGGRFQDVACSEDCKYAVAAINNGFIYTSSDYGQTWYDDNNAGYRFWEAVASDSTGQYLIAILNDYIYTSQDYGKIWTPNNKKGIWKDCTSDSTGKYLVIVENGGYIYTSDDYGGTWQKTSAPYEYWYSVTSSSSGKQLFAGADGVDIYASDDYGSTWYRNNAGAQKWWSIATDEDGDMAIAGAYYEYLYIEKNPPLTEEIASCFAADSVLTLRNQKQISIGDVKVGDEILGSDRYGNLSFSKVVAIPHGPNIREANFVHLFTSKGRDLKISLDHLILYSPTCSMNDLFIQKASDLSTGGCILEEKYELDSITNIEIVRSKGLYTVVAMEEYIIVNGLIVSPFAVTHTFASLFYDYTYRFMFRGFNLTLGDTNGVAKGLLSFATYFSEMLM